MPFPHRIITKREDIGDVFNESKENVLQKSNVSNLVGLLNQLNKISLYAHEIFTDVLQTTTNTGKRIKSAKQRVNNIQSQLPKIEGMLLTSAPNMFYDNPYPGKEYLRNDPLNGLLFSREDATSIVNRRREIAIAPTDMSKMDGVIPDRESCIKHFSDADFFINEWLENERKKREEERERRRQNKANRKKERHKRKSQKTIQKLKRKRYDAQGNEIKDDDEPETIAVQQFQLIDDTHRDWDKLLKSNKKAAKAKKQAQKEEARARDETQMVVQTQPQPQPPKPPQSALKSPSRPKHEHMVSYGVPDTAVKHVSVKSNPPPNPIALAQSESNSPPPSSNNAIVSSVPPPNPMELNGPPPNPLQLKPTLSQSQKTQKKLRGLSDEIPRDNSLLESSKLIDDQTYSPPELYATKYQKRDLDKESINPMNLGQAAQIITTSPKQVKPVAPKLGFLGDIQGFKAASLKKTEINVNRHKPKDKRTNLLDALRGGGARNQLSAVNLRKIAPKKEEKKNLIFQAMADRRRHMEDSSDESDSDWGSESE